MKTTEHSWKREGRTKQIKDTHVHGLEDSMMSPPPKAIDRVNAVAVRILENIFCENRKTRPKILLQFHGASNSKTMLKKRNKVQGLTRRHFKTYDHLRPRTVNETVRYGHGTDTKTHARARTGSPEVNPRVGGHRVSNEGTETIQGGNGDLFNNRSWGN